MKCDFNLNSCPEKESIVFDYDYVKSHEGIYVQNERSDNRIVLTKNSILGFISVVISPEGFFHTLPDSWKNAKFRLYNREIVLKFSN